MVVSIGQRFAPGGKTVVTGNTPALQTHLKRSLRYHGAEAKREVRHLGVDYAPRAMASGPSKRRSSKGSSKGASAPDNSASATALPHASSARPSGPPALTGPKLWVRPMHTSNTWTLRRARCGARGVRQERRAIRFRQAWIDRRRAKHRLRGRTHPLLGHGVLRPAAATRPSARGLEESDDTRVAS